VWVGVRRIHTLTHPGLSLLLATDGTAASAPAVALTAHLARLAHASVTLVAAMPGDPHAEIQRVKDALGAGAGVRDARVSTASIPDAIAAPGREPCDLVIAGLPAREAAEIAERVLQACDSHLLLVPAARPGAPIPSRVLVCVAVGEPGKETILFAGRLVRHFGAEAKLLTVLPPGAGAIPREMAARFLAAGIRTLATLGVPSSSALRSGTIVDGVAGEIGEGVTDMIVLGAPLPTAGEKVSLGPIARQLLEHGRERPLLVVRSGEAALAR
jgi:nucleotide-binding universal stress UspA family protein